MTAVNKIIAPKTAAKETAAKAAPEPEKVAAAAPSPPPPPRPLPTTDNGAETPATADASTPAAEKPVAEKQGDVPMAKEKEAAEFATPKPVAEKTAVEESVVAAVDDTVKNPGNMKPRRVALLDMADKEGKKKVRKFIIQINLLHPVHNFDSIAEGH